MIFIMIKVLSKLNNKFDIVFLDPPFKDKNLKEFLLKLKNFELKSKWINYHT
jgi:16S rRNA (guanine966-N2)-methyltransferase